MTSGGGQVVRRAGGPAHPTIEVVAAGAGCGPGRLSHRATDTPRLAYPGRAGDGFQRPLCSRVRQQVAAAFYDQAKQSEVTVLEEQGP
jgi:hypothetical protein